MFTGTKGDFKHCKQNGVGRTTILKFLGGTWKQSEIQFALDVLKDKTVDREAVESFKNKYQATEFKAAVKEAKIPVKEQKEVAEKIKSKVNGGRAIKEEVFKHFPLSILETKKSGPKALPMLDDFVVTTCREMGTLRLKLVAIDKNYDSVQRKLSRDGLYLATKDLQTILTKILQRGKE